MRWWFLLPAGLLSLVVGVVAGVQPPPDIAGLYLCDGRAPDGEPYQCATEIVMYADQATLRWRFHDGTEATGIGLISANVVSVVFKLDNGTIGLSSYIITGRGDDRQLTGRWTLPGSGTTHSETLTKTKAPSLEAISLDRIPL